MIRRRCRGGDTIDQVESTSDASSCRMSHQFVRTRFTQGGAGGKYGEITGKWDVDHIIPLRRLWEIPGFRDLNRADQIAIANHPDNLFPNPEGYNRSRQDKLPSEWTLYKGQQVPEDYLQDWCGKETKATDMVEEQISERLLAESKSRTQPPASASASQAAPVHTAPPVQAPQSPAAPAPVTVPAQPPAPETVAPSVVPTQPPAPPSTAAPAPQSGWWERNAGNVADGVGWTVTIVSCILDCVESLGTGAIADRAIGIAAREGTKELILDLVGSR